MISKTGKFFISSVRYSKTGDNGQDIKVTEQYVVDALSWTECEAKTIKEINDAEITAMKIAKFGEIFMSERESDDKFFECGVSFILMDEKTGKEKRTKVSYLVQSSSLDVAKRNLDEAMKPSMSDYVVNYVKETNILDVFE